VWKPSRCWNGVRDFPRRETLCVFAAIYRATFFCTSRRRRHRGLSSACAWCPHFHAISGHLVSLTSRSWSKSISPTTCKTFSKRQRMTKKTKNADRNRPEKTTPSCFAPDVTDKPRIRQEESSPDFSTIKTSLQYFILPEMLRLAIDPWMGGGEKQPLGSE